MRYSIKNKDDLKDLDQLADLQSKVTQVRLAERLRKQGFHFDIKELLKPVTKAVTDTSQKLLEDTKSTKKTIGELDESNVYVKVSELVN